MSVEVMPLPASVLTIPGVQPLEMEVVEVGDLGRSIRHAYDIEALPVVT